MAAERATLSVASDAYVRVFPPSRPRPPKVSAAPTAPGGMVFIDLANEFLDFVDVVTELQEIDQQIAFVDVVVIRWHAVSAWGDDEAQEAEATASQADLATTVAARFRALGRTGTVPVAVVRFRVGEECIVQWSPDTDEGVKRRLGELLARARAVEMRTLADWGAAIWHPRGYHYELPSGDHSGAFIRVAEVFREPRDVHVVSSWFARELREESAIVVDSATLTPLVIGLQALQASRGWAVGESETLDEYPRTRLDVARVVRRVVRESETVIGILSVNSSGGLRDLMHEALEDSLSVGKRWSLSILIDKAVGSKASTYPQPSDTGLHTESWWVLTADEYGTVSQSSCGFCRTNDRAHVVRIDPRSYEAMAITGDDLVTPSIRAADDSHGFWECCDRAQALGYDVFPKPGDSMVGRPKSSPMGIRVHFDRLLGEENALLPAVVTRLTEASTRRRIASARLRVPEIVVVHPDDASLPGWKAVSAAILEGLGWSDASIVAARPEDITPDSVVDAERVTILVLGAVTGRMLRMYVEAVQRAWAGKDRAIQGLVVHARPASYREWRSWKNSFGLRLEALWLTCLPWRSLIAEEQHLLTSSDLDERRLSTAGQSFLAERRSFASPPDLKERELAWAEGRTGASDPRSILWGSPPRSGTDTLTNRSLYGLELGIPAAIAAIGSAIHWRRIEARPNDPRRRMFEIPAILRSYYDAIIVASVLRWLHPSEAWWGESDVEAIAVIDDLVSKITSKDDRLILYPELILAAAMGKLPREAATHARNLIEGLVEDWEDSDKAPVELALAIYDHTSRKQKSLA